jgi:hypothetical protein
VNTLEDRIRAAARAAADAIADESAPPLDLSRAGHPPLRPWRGPGRGRLGRMLVPLTAAAAVVLVAAAAIAIPRTLDSGSRRHPVAGASTPAVSPTPAAVPSGQGKVLPGYLATLQLLGSSPPVDIRNAVTGALTAKIGLSPGYGWYAVAGQGPRTFIASKTLNNMGPTTSHFYRIEISDRGKVTSIRQVGAAVPGTVYAFSVTPDGRYVGYVLSIAYGPAGQDGRDEVVLANLTTGKVIASWPIPDIDYIGSMSIDAGGNALAIGAYYYHYNGVGTIYAVKHDLTQWTSVLRPATSGTPIDKVPQLLPQAAPLALSPDGATLYEFLQAGRVPSRPQQDRAPVTFDLAAVNASTGTVVAVLHTWRAPWPSFAPQLALSPAGDYLLITDGVSLARISTATGQYTALPGTVPELGPLVSEGKLPPGQGADTADPLAW